MKILNIVNIWIVVLYIPLQSVCDILQHILFCTSYTINGEHALLVGLQVFIVLVTVETPVILPRDNLLAGTVYKLDSISEGSKPLLLLVDDVHVVRRQLSFRWQRSHGVDRQVPRLTSVPAVSKKDDEDVREELEEAFVNESELLAEWDNEDPKICDDDMV